MELKDLAGIHMLDAVDYGTVLVNHTDSWNDGDRKVNQLRMRLDNVTYVCEEDPDDGYRSSMRDLRILGSEDKPITNVFGYIVVECRYAGSDNERHHKNNGYACGSTCDVLEIYDKENGKLIIEVGTENTGEYYPYYVANWNPMNLHINEGVEDDKETPDT
jgi:hypothetical protein